MWQSREVEVEPREESQSVYEVYLTSLSQLLPSGLHKVGKSHSNCM